METLLPSIGSPPTGSLGMGMGVAAVWVIRGGVKLAFKSTWPFTGTTSEEDFVGYDWVRSIDKWGIERKVTKVIKKKKTS